MSDAAPLTSGLTTSTAAASPTGSVPGSDPTFAPSDASPAGSGAAAPCADAPEPGPPEPASMAAFRAEGKRNPAAMAGRAVALDVIYVSVSQRTYGRSSMHGGDPFTVVHVAFPGALEDVMPCMMPRYEWPPAGVLPGTTIHVEGVWSFDRILQGGLVRGGGPLEIHGCKVASRAR